jgi:hypothetical protein
MFGLSEADWRARMPPLTRENEQAFAVWQFCEGWNPERLPLAVAWHGVEDVDLLITQLHLLRDRIEARERARREQNGQQPAHRRPQ